MGFVVRGRCDFRDGGRGLQVDTAFFDELFEYEGDELVGPESGGAFRESGTYAVGVDAMRSEGLLVFDDSDAFCDVGGNLFQKGEFFLGFGHDFVGPELEAARDGSPFAGDIVLFDVGAYSMHVFQLKFPDFCVASKEERLAVASILNILLVLDKLRYIQDPRKVPGISITVGRIIPFQ